MTAMSNALEDDLLDHVLKNTTYTQPTNLYLGLWTADDGLESGVVTSEVSGGAYARTTATFAAAASGTSTNSAAVSFPQATGAWGTVSHTALCSALTGAAVLFHGTLSADKIVSSGDTFKFNAADFSISMD